MSFNLNFRGTFDIKRAFELVLRQIFADETIMDERYRYVSPPDIPQEQREALEKQDIDTGGASDTKIRIYRSFPKRLLSYPAIIIRTLSFDASLTAMGEGREEVFGEHDNTGKLVRSAYGGYYIVPVELRVYSKESPDDRDKLTDILLVLLRILRRNYFARFGIGFTKIRVSGEDQAEDTRGDGVMTFSNSIILDCQTDYELILDVNESELFDKMLLKVYLQAQEGGELKLLV